MATFTLALRSLLRRKSRFLLIGFLVMIGTFLLVFGGTFAASAAKYSKQSIINSFTGDLIVYSERSREIPTPFSFLTPLPVIEDLERVNGFVQEHPMVEVSVPIAQNYGLISITRDGVGYDLPFIFYAVEPERYRAMFDNVPVTQGTYFQNSEGAPVGGILISEFQNTQYQEKYGVTLQPGEEVRLLSLTGGGSVNAVPSRLVGIFDPVYYRNVFNYINYMDIDSYTELYNFTGVTSESLPESYTEALSAVSEDDIFALADSEDFGALDVESLVDAELSGYTMIAVRLRDHDATDSFITEIENAGLKVKAASWDESSGFFARIADVLQGVIYGATFLIFLIVTFILMNTLIINILERTGEIGTLRAIGAEKGFVSAIFLWESFLLNGAAAMLGMLLALILALALGGGGLVLPDLISQYLVGGGPLRLELSPLPFLSGFLLVSIVSFLATLYPTRVAAGISPLVAMSGK